jgi:hypothetical protein
MRRARSSRKFGRSPVVSVGDFYTLVRCQIVKIALGGVVYIALDVCDFSRGHARRE